MNHRYPHFPIANLFSSLNFVLNMFFLGCCFGSNLGFVVKREGIDILGFLGF